MSPTFETDCLKVTNLAYEVTEESIKQFFGNNERSGGTDVTFVHRKNASTALVYFADYKSKPTSFNLRFIGFVCYLLDLFVRYTSEGICDNKQH